MYENTVFSRIIFRIKWVPYPEAIDRTQRKLRKLKRSRGQNPITENFHHTAGYHLCYKASRYFDTITLVYNPSFLALSD